MKKKSLFVILSLILTVPLIGTISFSNFEKVEAVTESKITLSWTKIGNVGTDGTPGQNADHLVNGVVDSGNPNEKWCSYIDNSNSFDAVFEASNPLVLTKYELVTGGDTAGSSSRNWYNWKITGADSSSGPWISSNVVVNHTGGGLGAANNKTYAFNDVTLIAKAFKYYKLEFSINATGSRYVQQMSEMYFYGVPCHQITYQDGDTTISDLTQTAYIEGTGLASLPDAPAKANMNFVGWYDAKTGGNKVTSIAETDTTDKTLYARYRYTNVSFITHQIGGWINDNGTKGFVAFGFEYTGPELGDIDSYGIITYKTIDAQTNHYNGTIAALKSNEGRFYTYIKCENGDKYYAKCYVIINGEAYYSEVIAATANTSGQEYIIPSV